MQLQSQLHTYLLRFSKNVSGFWVGGSRIIFKVLQLLHISPAYLTRTYRGMQDRRYLFRISFDLCSLDFPALLNLNGEVTARNLWGQKQEGGKSPAQQTLATGYIYCERIGEELRTTTRWALRSFGNGGGTSWTSI